MKTYLKNMEWLSTIMYKDAKISMIIDKTNDENYKKIYEDDYFVIYERLNA